SSTCNDLRGSLSRVDMPSNMSTSSLCTVIARYDSGAGSALHASVARSPARIVSRICLISVLTVAEAYFPHFAHLGQPLAQVMSRFGRCEGERSGRLGGLHQLGEDAADRLRMQERDRRAHRAVPRPLVHQPDPFPGELLE